MSKRSNEYFYKTCTLEKMSMKDKKRYEILNEYGYNFDSIKNKPDMADLNIKRHRNSESK